MNAPRRLLPSLVAALSLVGVVSLVVRAADSDGVQLRSMKYDAFRSHLAKAGAQGFKYTLVDAWASNCGPCKENFPHLIAMHKQFGPKGLQVISLSLDDVSDDKAVEAARAFLAAKQAKFLNVLLDEEFGYGFEKLEINAIPAVFVFGPDGKEVKRFTMDDADNQFTYEQVEKAVAGLLAGKPVASR